jgi:hypothetical protein
VDERRNAGDEPEAPATDAQETQAEAEASSGGIVGHLQNAAEPIASAVEPFIDHVVGPVAGAIGRWLRGLDAEPLASLYELFPEARQASPHELGMRFVPIEEIRGTAVAGAAQRGGDFLPLRPFRGENWAARWRRILDANAQLKPLPPVDLIKYNDEYWVVDGHNRVAATLYAKGVGLDAMVIELVPLDGRTSERPRNLLSYLGETGELRAAAEGRRPAMGMRQVERDSADEASVMYQAEAGSDPQGDPPS